MQDEYLLPSIPALSISFLIQNKYTDRCTAGTRGVDQCGLTPTQQGFSWIRGDCRKAKNPLGIIHYNGVKNLPKNDVAF
ncbi:hypothetical protein QF000_003814 [Paraburkholderia atlantica]|uniref:Uncharacterized protein n=1 Tax=Paraburkholderia atlantica TaxID=2654982 RepID=A0A6I1PTG3_PARAM|nr:hypothetical protein [Paraburkholderia atlantica]MBB5422413.1 hypothetical protein [Paraburkholderia atlantica]MPW05535.1 hypothetical protein [Paraburkholderia atlantica]